MFMPAFVEMVVEILRALLIEAILERVRNLRFSGSSHGMNAVRRRVQRRVRHQLVNRMSTGRKRQRALAPTFPYL